jgi:methylmalonyl-CoA mutase cobalamin-binding domain/chain
MAGTGGSAGDITEVTAASRPAQAAAELHRPVHPVRLVTAASLFDGHDAAINVMRRILQSQGAEVVHLGHNRSVDEVVRAAVQEDVQGVAVSSYQGGHLEYFGYLVDRLRAEGRPDIKVFGGGGGVIVAEEVEQLHASGVAHIFTPEDGQRLGLAAMVNTIIATCDIDLTATGAPRPTAPAASTARPASRPCSPATSGRSRGPSPRSRAAPSTRAGCPSCATSPPATPSRSSASRAPVARASRRSPTSSSAACASTSTTSCGSPSSPSTPPAGGPAAPCSATASA